MSGKYLFDASAIIALAVKHRVDAFMGNFTLELAGYEIGNYLWKETHLNKSLKSDELITLVKIFLGILREMNILNGWPPDAEVAKLAAKTNLTYYDAAYLHHAKKNGLTLVTEDIELKERGSRVAEVLTTGSITSK